MRFPNPKVPATVRRRTPLCPPIFRFLAAAAVLALTLAACGSPFDGLRETARRAIQPSADADPGRPLEPGSPGALSSWKVRLPGRGEWATIVATVPADGFLLARTRGKHDAILRAYDARGRLLAENDDAFELDAAVVVRGRAGETIALEVALSSAVENYPEKPEVAVTLSPIDLPAVATRPGQALSAPMAPGAPARFTFTPAGDGVVLLETAGDGDLDTLLTLLDADGRVVGHNDDRTTDDFTSELAARVRAGRPYEVIVSGLGRDDEGDVILEISAVRPDGEDDYPDLAADPPGATIPVGSKGREVRGEWETWGDADVVDLVFSDPGLYRLEIRSNLDSILATYDAEGRVQRADDDTGEDNNGRLVVEAAGGERIRARLRPLRDVLRGSWRLVVKRVGDALPVPIARRLADSAPIPGPGGRVRALVVCAADFPSPRSLIDAITDGWNLRRFLIGSLGARPEDVRVMTDDLDVRADDLDVPRIRAAIAELAASAGPQDLVVFAYSGHGDAANGRSSLEPEARGYVEDVLRRDLDRIRAGRVIILVDACNSGSFVESLAAPNRWVYVSSRADETSNAGVSGQPERTGGSVFLACLLDELMYGAGVRDWSEAFRRAAAAVTRLDAEQHPQAYEPATLVFRAP